MGVLLGEKDMLQRRFFLVWLMMTSTVCAEARLAEDKFFGNCITLKPRKKRILILTSTGGGGHMSATQAITCYLENTYEIKQAMVFGEGKDRLATLTAQADAYRAARLTGPRIVRILYNTDSACRQRRAGCAHRRGPVNFE